MQWLQAAGYGNSWSGTKHSTAFHIVWEQWLTSALNNVCTLQTLETFTGFLKWYYDENHIFSIEAILRHKQVAWMRRKMLFTIFKYLILFQRYSSFKNMQISLVMTSYTQLSFDQIWWKKISQPIFIRNVSFFAVRLY